MKGFNFLSNFKWEPRKGNELAVCVVFSQFPYSLLSVLTNLLFSDLFFPPSAFPYIGWDILLRAFFEEFSSADDVCLHIQTHHYGNRNPHNPSGILGIIEKWKIKSGFSARSDLPCLSIQADLLPLSKIPSLYAAADAFVLATRGEGWGLPIVEAMAMGLPTIATNWSGPADILTDSTGYLLNVEKMVPCEGRDYENGQMWALPSTSHLRTLMRRVFTNREESKRVGQAALTRVREQYERSRLADVIGARFQQIGRLLPAST